MTAAALQVGVDFVFHPRVSRLWEGPCPGDAIAMWLFGCAWSAREGQDGLVTLGETKRLGGLHPDAAAELVRAGLWETVDGGFEILDWPNVYPSTDQLKARRNADKRRKARQRERERQARNKGTATPAGTLLDAAPALPAVLAGHTARDVEFAAAQAPCDKLRGIEKVVRRLDALPATAARHTVTGRDGAGGALEVDPSHRDVDGLRIDTCHAVTGHEADSPSHESEDDDFDNLFAPRAASAASSDSPARHAVTPKTASHVNQVGAGTIGALRDLNLKKENSSSPAPPSAASPIRIAAAPQPTRRRAAARRSEPSLLLPFDAPDSPQPDAENAAVRGAALIFEATTLQYPPFTQRNKASCAWLAGRPDEEWAVAKRVLLQEVNKPGVKHMLTPQHIADHWVQYSSGVAPRGRAEIERERAKLKAARGGFVGPAPLPTLAEYQAEYEAVRNGTWGTRAC